jgi:hypothetical protein
MKVIDLLWTLNLKTRTKLSYGRKVNSKLYCTIFLWTKTIISWHLIIMHNTACQIITIHTVSYVCITFCKSYIRYPLTNFELGLQ